VTPMRYVYPLDPECPDRHRKQCKRCQEYGPPPTCDGMIAEIVGGPSGQARSGGRLELEHGRTSSISPGLSLRLWLNMMGNYEPAPVDFFVDVGNNVVGRGVFAIFHFWGPTLLTDLPREIAIDVNMLV
jgi:hypothetical protein